MNREEWERTLARDLGQVEAEYLERIASYLGDPPSMADIPPELWQEYAQAVNRVLSNHLQDGALGWLREWIEQNPIGLEWDELVADAAAWSAESITALANQIADNSRRVVERVLTDAAVTGYTPEDIIGRLAFRFGPVHAEMVAITEITRALSWAASELQARLAKQGVKTVRRWLTAEDEKVCPICAPLDHTTKESGAWDEAGLPDGPPAHPRCRCQAVVEYAK